jgi:hypothetical protein
VVISWTTDKQIQVGALSKTFVSILLLNHSNSSKRLTNRESVAVVAVDQRRRAIFTKYVC